MQEILTMKIINFKGIRYLTSIITQKHPCKVSLSSYDCSLKIDYSILQSIDWVQIQINGVCWFICWHFRLTYHSNKTLKAFPMTVVFVQTLYAVFHECLNFIFQEIYWPRELTFLIKKDFTSLLSIHPIKLFTVCFRPFKL